MKRSLCLLILTLSGIFCSAQNRYRVDSLVHSLKDQTNDSIIFYTYCELALELQNDSAKAFGYANNAKAIADKNNSAHWKCETSILFSKLYFVLNDAATAEKYEEDALKYAKGSHYELGIARCHVIQAAILNIQDDENDSIHALIEKNYNEALAIFSRYNDETDLARAYNNLAAYFYNSSRSDTALKLLLVALDHGKRSGNLQAISNTYNTLRLIYNFKNEYQKSFDVALKYYKTIEAMKDSSKFGSANVYISRPLIDIKNYDEAIRYLEKAIVFAKKDDNNDLLSSCYTNYATAQMGKKNYTKAVELNRIALQYYYKTPGGRRLPIILGNMGEAFIGLNMPDSALSCQERALAIRIKQKNNEGIMFSYKSFAEIYLTTKDYRKALEYGRKAIDLSYSHHIHSYDIDIYSVLYPAAKGIGNYQLAFCYLDTLKRLNDSLNSAEGSAHINDLRMNFENDKIEKERELAEKLKDEQHKAEVDRQRNYIIFGIVLLILLSAFSLVVLRNFRQKKKANLILAEQKEEIEKQKDIVEDKNKEIIDSIRYAKRIQQSLLPTEKYIHRNLKKNERKD